jgi:hypothetical protein
MTVSVRRGESRVEGKRGADENLTKTHGSEPAIQVSAGWDPIVLMVGRRDVFGITCVLVMVLVLSHSILYEKKYLGLREYSRNAMLAIAVIWANGALCCASVQKP